MQYSYDFHRVQLLRSREGLIPETDYTVVIQRHAEQDWEFIQALSCEWHIEPHIQLIFRRGTQ